MWNTVPEFWVKCPDRYYTVLKADKSAPRVASRTHLHALLYLIKMAGGWKKVDSYVSESAILADKYLAIREMQTPMIDYLEWDPGPMRRTAHNQLGAQGVRLHLLGKDLLKNPMCAELKEILEQVVDYVLISDGAWSLTDISSDTESWLFLRLQALTYRLLLLEKAEPLEDCIRLTMLNFLLNAVQHHGAQVSAALVAVRLRSALITMEPWEERFGDGLLLWVLCTGAMTSIATPERE